VPLLPIQQWFLEQTHHPHHFNQSMLLQTGKVEQAHLQQAIDALVAHHDALRMHVIPTESGWQQSYQQDVQVTLEVVDVQTDANPIASMEQYAEEAQASLHVTEGPLFRAIWFPLSADTGRLLLIAHHLIMDGVSWRIVLEDVETLYQQIAAGKNVQLPAKTSSYRQWAQHLQQRALLQKVEADREKWQQIKSTTLPQDKLGMNIESSVAQTQLILSASDTEKLLTETTGRTHATVEEILLTALLQALQKWSGSSTHTIHMEGHGRDESEDMDLSRTVGWFTALYPVMIQLTSANMGDVLQGVKETLRDRSSKGINYGLLRYLHPAPISELQASTSFNYLGQFQTNNAESKDKLILGNAAERSGNPIAPESMRSHLLDVVAVISQGRLQITWLYSTNIHHEQTIANLKKDYHIYLEALITGKEKNVGITASDFPEADLSKKDMQKVLQLLQKKSKGR
jgi:non-ribosomal peptide synthase protein (TIGR01720 family)